AGEAELASERLVGGLPIRLPSVDVHTVGAGGGSIVRRDAGGALRVGPESAGAEPGPACYGRGGTLPTVTDANLLLDRLPARLALGLVASDERRIRVRSYVVPLENAGELPAEGEADLRYRGQSFELTVPLGGDLAGAFHRAHEERYGFAERERPLELVAVRTMDV